MISIFASVDSSFETFELSSALSGQKLHFKESIWALEEIESTWGKF